MSKFFARSPLADLLIRICSALLFFILLPAILIAALVPGIDRLHIGQKRTVTRRPLRKPT